MELYHSTNIEITKITKNGRFGYFLFFGDSQSGKSHGDIVYKLEIDEEILINASSIFYQENSYELLKREIEEVQELCSVDEQTAMNYIDESDHYPVIDSESAEISWELQLIAARCAKKLGYAGVGVKDEHGISWMIDMSDKKLHRVN